MIRRMLKKCNVLGTELVFDIPPVILWRSSSRLQIRSCSLTVCISWLTCGSAPMRKYLFLHTVVEAPVFADFHKRRTFEVHTLKGALNSNGNRDENEPDSLRTTIGDTTSADANRLLCHWCSSLVGCTKVSGMNLWQLVHLPRPSTPFSCTAVVAGSLS